MHPKRLLLLMLLPFLACACEEDNGSYTQIKGIENLIYLSIKAHRTDQGLGGPFVLQFVMVREAQIYSYKMANGVEELGTQGLDEHWNTIHEKLGGYNDQAMVLRTLSDDEDAILEQLLQMPGSDSILLADVTQCGVGVEADSAGVNYVTVMLMKAD